MADERVAYPDSSRRSEQLSYIMFFDPSYGLITMNFQSFNHFLKKKIEIVLKRVDQVKLTGQKGRGGPYVIGCT